MTPAHRTGDLAELVCSNSLRSSSISNAVGVLKVELRRLDSLLMDSADRAAVPAGNALAVDREVFSRLVGEAIERNPLIALHRGEVSGIEDLDCPSIVATGPLTSDSMSESIARLTGREHLYFYDAIAPIVESDSIDTDVVFAQSRYDKGEGNDYLNSPMTREQYAAFVDELRNAEKVPLRHFEEEKLFSGCMPVEAIARSGDMALAHGPMKPVGLSDPRTGERPFAVVQLRRENRGGTAWNLVGFQTKLTHSEQRRVFRMIPGLEKARFLRLGSAHRNTFVDSPALLDERLRLRGYEPPLLFAGQITGVEGYVESMASGLLAGLLLASDLTGIPVPPSCMLM